MSLIKNVNALLELSFEDLNNLQAFAEHLPFLFAFPQEELLSLCDNLFKHGNFKPSMARTIDLDAKALEVAQMDPTQPRTAGLLPGTWMTYQCECGKKFAYPMLPKPPKLCYHCLSPMAQQKRLLNLSQYLAAEAAGLR